MKRDFRFYTRETIGAFGDIGTFAPLFISLVVLNRLNPQVILITSGLIYICCGLYYGIPMSVQPLKAVAAISIAMGLGESVISACGILIGILLLIFSLTGLPEILSKIFSRPITRGIQLGIGLILMRTGWFLIQSKLNIPNTIDTSLFKRTEFLFPSLTDFYKAFFLLVLPQLPLTLGNSIVATKDAASVYFGKRAHKVTERALVFDIGIVNIITGFLRGMPLCHGSGGLTAHYVFGARTGMSSIIIGSTFLILGVAFGSYSSILFQKIPNFILGIMVLFVGVRHSLLVRNLQETEDLIFAIFIGISAFITNNLAVAFTFGIIAYFLRRLIGRLIKKLANLPSFNPPQ